MTPDRYEVSPTGSQRPPGQFKKRGSQTGFPTWGGFLFGLPFVGAGVAISLIGFKVLPVDPRSVNAPYWVLTVAGLSFALGGFLVWGMTWKQFAANRRRAQAARRHLDEPALADYPWHPDGFSVSEWPGVARAFAIALALTIFLSMFNWWAFGMRGPGMLKAIVCLFDLAALGAWVQMFLQLGRALKFGHSRVDFVAFPFRPPDPVVLRWQSFGGINRLNKGTFTLRCVQEWIETRKIGNKRSTYTAHEDIWSATWHFDQPRNFPLLEKVELRYEPPVDSPPTQLSAERPVYWDLEVKLDLPGLDFSETYLVPVYGRTKPAVNIPAIASAAR